MLELKITRLLKKLAKHILASYIQIEKTKKPENNQ